MEPSDAGRQLGLAEQSDCARPFSLLKQPSNAATPYAMVSTLHIANAMTAEGQLVPDKWKDRIIIELGANHINTIAQSLFKQKSFTGKYFVLSFEPVLDKYAANLGDASLPGRLTPAGYHNQRGIILPFAVGPDEGTAEFNVPSGGAGCASLLNLNPQNKGKRHLNWACEQVADVRRTQVISLRTVLGFLPSGSEVPFLKVDVQRVDLRAVLSAGDRIKALQRVQMEVTSGPGERGQGSCYEALRKMAQVGFRLATAQEVAGFAPLEGAYGTPLVYDGGPIQCNFTVAGKKTQLGDEVDVFFIRQDPPVPTAFHLLGRSELKLWRSGSKDPKE